MTLIGCRLSGSVARHDDGKFARQAIQNLAHLSDQRGCFGYVKVKMSADKMSGLFVGSNVPLHEDDAQHVRRNQVVAANIADEDARRITVIDGVLNQLHGSSTPDALRPVPSRIWKVMVMTHCVRIGRIPPPRRPTAKAPISEFVAGPDRYITLCCTGLFRFVPAQRRGPAGCDLPGRASLIISVRPTPAAPADRRRRVLQAEQSVARFGALHAAAITLTAPGPPP